MTNFRFLILLCVLIVFSGCHSIKNAENKPPYRLFYNHDGTEILGNRWHNGRPLTVQDVQSYVDVLSGTPVTTFMICSGAMLPYYNSKVERPIGVKRTKPFPEPVNCEVGENVFKYYENFKHLNEQNTDIIKICLDRARYNNMEAFITFRVNDLHFTIPSVYCPYSQSDFWIDNPQFRVNDAYGWHADGALDFAFPEVRQYKIDLIKEQCEMYDIDGFELDFLRFLVYFKDGKGRENKDLMTDFVSKVHDIIKDISAERKKKVLLSVRIPPRMSLCLDKGFDVQKWVDDGLIDFITVSAHWQDDPNLPVAEFKKSLNRDIPVYASMDCGQYKNYEFRTHGIYRGTAAHHLGQGADGLYLFNFFFKDYFENNYQPVPAQGDQVFNRIRTPQLINDLANLDSLAGKNKVYTFCDGVNEYGYIHETPLPMEIMAQENGSLNIFISEKEIDKYENAVLFLRLVGLNDINVNINTIPIHKSPNDKAEQYGRDLNLSDGEYVLPFFIEPGILKNGNNIVTITPKKENLLVKRVDLAVKYGDVNKAGYF